LLIYSLYASYQCLSALSCLDFPSVQVKLPLHNDFVFNTPHGTRFRVQFGNDWVDSEIVLEQELAALPNGLNVLQQWKAEQATRLRQR